MPSRLLGRLKKLEEKMGNDENNLLVTIVPQDMTIEEVDVLIHEKNPNFKGLHLIINTYGDGQADKQIEYDDIDLKIQQEMERIKRHGFKETEIEKALGTSEITSGDRDIKGERDPEAGTGTREPGEGRDDFSRLFRRHRR